MWQLAKMMSARRSDLDPMADDGEDEGEVAEVELHGRGGGGTTTTSTGFR